MAWLTSRRWNFRRRAVMTEKKTKKINVILFFTTFSHSPFSKYSSILSPDTQIYTLFSLHLKPHPLSPHFTVPSSPECHRVSALYIDSCSCPARAWEKPVAIISFPLLSPKGRCLSVFKVEGVECWGFLFFHFLNLPLLYFRTLEGLGRWRGRYYSIVERLTLQKSFLFSLWARWLFLLYLVIWNFQMWDYSETGLYVLKI